MLSVICYISVMIFIILYFLGIIPNIFFAIAVPCLMSFICYVGKLMAKCYEFEIEKLRTKQAYDEIKKENDAIDEQRDKQINKLNSLLNSLRAFKEDNRKQHFFNFEGDDGG